MRGGVFTRMARIYTNSGGVMHYHSMVILETVLKLETTLRRVFWLWASLAQWLQPALGMRPLCRLAQRQNPSPPLHFQF